MLNGCKSGDFQRIPYSEPVAVSALRSRGMIVNAAGVVPMGLSRLADPDASHVVTRCAHCSASLDGTLGAGRQWFAEHRQEVHPELAEPAPRRVRWRRRAASVG